MNKTVCMKRVNTLSSVANVGASEDHLDVAIFYCLNVLTKRHSPSDQFRTVFSKGMFLKPNTKAFIHVLHFLFNVHDAKEFRKRFYWPIFDKNAESAFRSSTVEYVNSLVDRGKLDMEKIKAHTVVLPGGLKFMKFLLVLIKFVMKEELRRTGVNSGGKIISKSDIGQLVDYHQEWEEVGNKTREIIQKDLTMIQCRIQEIDEWIEKLFAECQGPAKQMSFEKLMELWGTFNRTSFQETEAKRQRLQDVTAEYNKVIATAKKKLEPKELTLGIKEGELKETLYRLEVLFPNNACYFREVFDENGKIDAVKLFEIIIFLLPDISQHLAGFSVRSIESLKFEMKELSKVALKSDSIYHELSSLRRTLPFGDAKFQELNNQNDATDELNGDLGIRNKIFNTPPITLNFQEDLEAGSRPISKRNRLALLDDDQIHQMNLRMRLLSSSICQQLPKTPRSVKKPKVAPASPGNVFAVPKPTKKERMNPLSMLNKITAHGKLKTKQPLPVNSTLNISSLSTLGEISLRPEFSSTLLGTPEKQTSQNRRSINGNEQTTFQPSPRFKTIYSEDLIMESSSTKGAMPPDSLFLLSQGRRNSKRRSSLLQLDQMQTSPSGKLEPLVMKVKGAPITAMTNNVEMPEIRIFAPEEMDSEICEEGKANVTRVEGELRTEFDDKEDLERTLHQEENDASVDLSHTLVALGMSQLTLTCPDDVNRPNALQPAAVPMQTMDEDLFNVSDGILTDFD
ncbi:augmin complex subunit dgt6-like [Ochlerotatus camptorhynchus]|uniref:augmin complex subunit dgt6-like n=1 Tax=Ochlerotatus camptorhynchus TaxID=644619 RepID=UPI0031E0BDB9